MVLFFSTNKIKIWYSDKKFNYISFFPTFINLKLGFLCLIPRKHKWEFQKPKTEDEGQHFIPLINKYITDASGKHVFTDFIYYWLLKQENIHKQTHKPLKR